MGLPKISSPIFELTLPSTGEQVKYKPFTVKEEKILLIAQETTEIDQAIMSIQQVVNNSMIDKSVNDLSMFDLEYVLLTLRSKSVDNKVVFTIEDPDTKEKIKLELNLDDVKINTPKNHTKEIKINDEFILYMRYPSINEFISLVKNPNDLNLSFDVMLSCMDKLVTEKEVFKFSDYTKEERESFVDDMDAHVVSDIKEFFETTPKLRHELKYKNSTGNEKTFVIEGLETFFI